VAQFFWRLSIRNLFYLNDSFYLPLLGFDPLWSSQQHADATVYLVCSVLTRLGFCYPEESHLLPSPPLVWLGFLVNTILRTFSIPVETLVKFLSLLWDIVASGSVSFYVFREVH
jgi:hypothetical protein